MVKDVEMRDGSAGSCGKSKEIVEAQRTYYMEGKTRALSARIDALNRLEQSILTYEQELYQALRSDLGKSRAESYMCEVGLVLSELSYMIRHTPSYAKEKTVLTPLAQFASRSYKKPSPYGVVLVMSPWNYPFLLTIDPLIDAIAAGNTVVLKPSAYSPHTSRVIETIITECFDPQYVAVVNGGRAENNTLLNEHFDYIFFTGSQHVGREVMAKASVHLTPVTLELGGKSPCIVEKSANLKLAARRIVFGKYLNCGQTCVAPDYILVKREVHDKLIEALKNFKFEISGFNKDLSHVTLGGINIENINPKTMESTITEDLYFAGEVLEPVGPTGGYNLKIAFSTGYLAGLSASKE